MDNWTMWLCAAAFFASLVAWDDINDREYFKATLSFVSTTAILFVVMMCLDMAGALSSTGGSTCFGPPVGCLDD